MRERLGAGGFVAALAALPWVGMGVVHLLTGRDVGTGVQPAWLLLGAATLAVLSRRRLRPAAPPPRPAFLLPAAIGATLALSALGIALAPGLSTPVEALSRFIKQILQMAIMAAFTVWSWRWVSGPARWRLASRVIVAAALGQAAYGALQFVHWYHPVPLYPALETVFTSNPAILSGSEQVHLADGFRNLPRLRGTMCEPLYLGNFLLLALPLVPLTGWRRAWRTAAAALLALLLVLTWSRGAWLAAGVGAVAALVPTGDARRPARRDLLLAGVVLAALAALLALVLGPDRLGLLGDRLAQSFSRRDWSNLTRLHSMQAAWRAFQLSPLVGVGWGQYAFHFPALVDPAGLQSQFTWPVVNSFPLKILAETGLAGAAAWLAAGVALARAAWRRRARPAVHWTAVACGAVWLQLLVFSQYNLPHIWVAPGLLLAALREDAPGEAA